ncbi:MAG: 50S ribosomal protein L31e [Nanoarchaeota archaeon]
MTEAQTKTLIREYIIPLRRVWLRVPEYKRAGKAVKAIKQFIAKHMKVAERDLDKVKVDVYFNNEIWFRGRASPPAKVKVRAIKEGEIVRVELAETSKHLDFLKKKNEKFRKESAKKEEPKKEEKKEEKTEEQKKDESEKEKAVEQQNIKQAEQQAKAEKHITKVDKITHPQRMALKK